MTPSDSPLALAFAENAVQHLRDEYLPRWKTLLDKLPEEALWWRPHPDCLCIGVIMRHLRGNVTQWIVSGLGGELDARNRGEEFTGDFVQSKSELQAGLEMAVHKACNIISDLGQRDLLQIERIQGYEKTRLAAIFHVVEHFSWHTGEATHIAKAYLGQGHGIAYYNNAKLNSIRNG